MTLRVRYRILKCRAFVSIFSSRLSVWSALPASFAAEALEIGAVRDVKGKVTG
jgi:hypothetical protein